MSGYKELLTYKQSVEIYDLTVEFCQKFLPGRELLRQRDQMVQAARSGKQNIVESYSFKSLKSYIKLLGVSRGSLEELLEDYNDFARLRDIELWSKDDSRFKEIEGSKDSKGNKERHRLPPNTPRPFQPLLPRQLPDSPRQPNALFAPSAN